MSYKLVKEDEKAFHLAHPDGRKFSVAKSAIGPEVHEKIRKMADGGEVESDAGDELESEETPGGAIPEQMGEAQETPNPNDVPVNTTSMPQLPESLATQPPMEMPAQTPEAGAPQEKTAAAAPTADKSWKDVGPKTEQQALESARPKPTGDYLADLMNQQKYAIDTMTQAKTDETAANLKSQEVFNQDLAKSQAAFEKQFKENEMDRKKLHDDIAGGKVDPMRLWHHAGVGGQIAAGIGIMLGGLGAGLSHGPNMALQTVNGLIDKDIDAQKSDLGRKESLLASNMRRYGDLRQGQLATKIQMLTGLQGQLSLNALKSGSASARAAADMQKSQIEQTLLPMKIQMANLQAQAKQMGLGGAGGGTPLEQESFQQRSDPRRVPIGNAAYLAQSPDEAKDLRERAGAHAGIMKGLQSMEALGPSALLSGSPEHGRAEVIKEAMKTNLAQLMSPSPRVSPELREAAGKMIDDPTSLKEVFQKGVKNAAITKFLNDTMQSKYKEKLPGYQPTAEKYPSFQEHPAVTKK